MGATTVAATTAALWCRQAVAYPLGAFLVVAYPVDRSHRLLGLAARPVGPVLDCSTYTQRGKGTTCRSIRRIRFNAKRCCHRIQCGRQCPAQALRLLSYIKVALSS